MYDFTNLSDVEFERLCGDVLSRKLGIKLRFFAPGRDGGIDLVDDTVQKNIVVQVKHYAKSSFPSLLSSLKKEVEKVKKLDPKQYYICVSQELTASNITDIYKLFEDYMENSNNVITRDKLVEFLDQDSNQDILRKNFKLWLLSDRVLKDIFNNRVFIDGEVLLDEINEEFKYFVQTRIFNEALETLKESRILMIQGGPGVGKSINSKMLAAAFVKDDYIIRYTTDGQVSSIKNVISQDPDAKEVILLDDCLGQYYFNLKEGQDRELISLIQYIKQHKNKVLILNTRVTILNEARRSRLEFRRFLEKKKLPLKTLNMEDISREEKAQIFYNHLLKNKIPKEYYDELKEGLGYKHIILHENYNPRIIEFVTEEYRYRTVSAKEYYNYIMKNLDNPNDVWSDEFEQKLHEVDRIFMHTLFSLTNTYIDIDSLEECFIHRLSTEGQSYSTTDQFSVVKSRLSKSLIRIVDDNGSKKVGVLNPSINDYLHHHISTNKIALNSIRESILYIEQLERMYETKVAKEILIDQLKSGEFVKYKSVRNKKLMYLYYGIATFNITNDAYKEIVINNFDKVVMSFNFFDEKIKKQDLIFKFLDEPSLYDFYKIGESLRSSTFIEHFIKFLDYKDLSKVLFLLTKGKNLNGLKELSIISSELLDGIGNYIHSFDVYDYIDGVGAFDPFFDFFHEMISPELSEDRKKEIDEEIDKKLKEETQRLLTMMVTYVKKEIKNELNKTIGYYLFQKQIEDMVIGESENWTYEIEDTLRTYIYPEPDDDRYEYDPEENQGYELGEKDGIDVIFDREYTELDD
ncbi:nSTAND3 domain-containing NTPase [Priestia endophytica]